MKKAVDGLVLRQCPIGDNDRLLTVLTGADGKMLMNAKGARSMKSKVLPLCRQYTYANIEYYEKADRKWLSGGSVNDSFFGLSADIEGLSLAAYICDVADEISGEGVDASDVLRMTLNALYLIDKKQKPYWQIKAVYELFAVVVSGMEPDLSACGKCRKSGHSEYWLDVMNGRIVCSECMSRSGGGSVPLEIDEYATRNILLPLDASSLEAARYVLSSDISRAFAFELKSERSIELFARATESYLLNHLERNFDTLEFLKSVTDGK